MFWPNIIATHAYLLVEQQHVRTPRAVALCTCQCVLCFAHPLFNWRRNSMQLLVKFVLFTHRRILKLSSPSAVFVPVSAGRCVKTSASETANIETEILPIVTYEAGYCENIHDDGVFITKDCNPKRKQKLP